MSQVVDHLQYLNPGAGTVCSSGLHSHAKENKPFQPPELPAPKPQARVTGLPARPAAASGLCPGTAFWFSPWLTATGSSTQRNPVKVRIGQGLGDHQPSLGSWVPSKTFGSSAPAGRAPFGSTPSVKIVKKPCGLSSLLHKMRRVAYEASGVSQRFWSHRPASATATHLLKDRVCGDAGGPPPSARPGQCHAWPGHFPA